MVQVFAIVPRARLEAVGVAARLMMRSGSLQGAQRQACRERNWSVRYAGDASLRRNRVADLVVAVG